ncbi:MAG TPA: aspartate aminotransferase family protein, partial [Burkholderiaceae bacterium]|nr:aspartate aminotransferase family protein [Burkholderiaceae bacterium]
HCAGARQLAEHVAGVPGIRVLNEVCLNQVTLSFGADEEAADANALTEAVIDEIQRENTSFVAGADWQGRRIMRVSVIARDTGPRDIARLADSIVRAWQRVVQRQGRPLPAV